MTIRHMKIFLALCEAGYNTTRTAEKLHMTQPAVSLAIKELEQYYNVRLFERMGKRLSITEAGRMLEKYSERISSLFDEMEKGLYGWDRSGVIRIGASLTIGSRSLPAYVRAFGKVYPETKVRAVVGQTDILVGKIMANELDVALVEGAVDDGVIVSEPFMEDSLCVICPPDMDTEDSISAEEFVRHPVLLREKGSGTRAVFDRAAENIGISVEPLWEAMGNTAVINGVTNGLGLGVVARRMAEDYIASGKVREISVEGLELSRRLYIIYHKDKFLTQAMNDFINICRTIK